MDTKIGYIYTRNHPSYDVDDACKMGKALNIPERDSQYATGEIKRGYFSAVFAVPITKMGLIERLLQHEFRELHVKYDGGTEFYSKHVITKIEPYLVSIGVWYRKLTKEDIDDMVRRYRIRNTIKKINIKTLVNILKYRRKNEQVVSYIPRPDQKIIIEKAVSYFQKHDKGMLVLACGVGKTLISLWVSQKLNSSTILIGVPNKLLLGQWKEIICKLFQGIPYLIVSGGVDIETIMKFLDVNQNNCFLLTTYSSAHKVYDATRNNQFTFGMKINDEAHHLTTTNMRLEKTEKTYIQMLNISSEKQLSLTATMKQLETLSEGEGVVVSNDNVVYFGEIIDRKCLSWAIDENILCDYMIQTIVADEEEFKRHSSFFHLTDDVEKRLFLSAFVALKSIFDGHSHHLLIYANNKKNAFKIKKHIKSIIDNDYFDVRTGFYYSDYHSEMKSTEQDL